ncbi:MAG: 3-isopropylmalate dehydratase large subunit [Pseudomonadota bacterium]
MPQTLFEKIWDAHSVGETGGWTILYIDRHLGHDGSSRALNMLRKRGLSLRRPDQTLIVFDHVIPTVNQADALDDPQMREMLDTVRDFAKRYDMKHVYDVSDPRNGISHVVGPEQGFSLPGCTLVCGDSHTATHGAFGALAFGIGASEVEHVFGTQTLLQRKPKTMRIDVSGALPDQVYAKDIILAVIGEIGTGGGTGCVIEYAGDAMRALSMEGRMTVCNMTIEAGARAGLVAPDQTTYDYLMGRPLAPAGDDWDAALAYWQTLPSDAGATFDQSASLDVSRLAPQVTWGTNPSMVSAVDGKVPKLGDADDEAQAETWERAYEYMGVQPGEAIEDLKVDRVFLGSCTNSRIEDLREAATYVKGKKVHDSVHAMVVPGSGLVKAEAEAEGLDRIFREAGFEWREPGCSMCVGMNGDLIAPGERCASTSNRNFEGRQGRGGRTHLVSPAMAVSAAVNGQFVDTRSIERVEL